MLNKYYGITNIKDYPLRKLVDFLNYAYEREVYEKWSSLYPLMECGLMPYVSFKEYKNKIKENIKVTTNSSKLTDEEILEQGIKMAKAYENQQKKAGENINGNI